MVANKKKIKVILVDDHPVFRTGLKYILEERGMEVIGEAKDGIEAIDIIENLLPDVVLMDIFMPRMDGIEATAEIKRKHPNIAVLIMTMSDRESDLLAALKAGASAYLLKSITTDELCNAVEDAIEKNNRIIIETSGIALRPSRKLEEIQNTKEIYPTLTDRETEVLGFIAEGLSNRVIADRLSISENTVKAHITRILSKLHSKNRRDAVNIYGNLAPNKIT
jgi:two-component system nitrate/nitrite response regulator NarL